MKSEVPPRYNPHMKKVPRMVLFWLLLGWIFVMLYPNPSVLVRSIHNIRHPDVDPAAVKELAATLPNDPRLIENAVLTRIVPYSYDWQVNGVPWYFPTTAEVLKWKRGDCESRAVVLASILKAKGIPFTLVMSFDHIWVQYPGKASNALENGGVTFAQWVNGRLVVHWPKDFHLGAEINAQLGDYWAPMPVTRKLLLFGGALLLILINPVAVARRREDGYDDGGRLLAAPVSPPWSIFRPPSTARQTGSAPAATPSEPRVGSPGQPS